MKTVLAAALASVAFVAVPADAATLLQYNFTGASGSQTSTAASNVATGLTGQAITRGAGLTATSGAGSLNSSGWTGQATDFVSFGFSVLAGYTAQVDQIQLGTRSSNTGSGSINLTYSLDNGSTFTTLKTFAQSGGVDLYQNLTFAALNVTDSILFRLVANGTRAANGGTTAASGTFRVENYNSSPFSINGSVAAASAVPEPAAWALMILGFGVVGASMRRRQSVRVTFA